MSEKISPLAQELLSRADSIFTKIAEAAGKAGDFASEQLPDIAYQFIAYNRVYFTTIILVEILMVVATIWAARRWAKETDGFIFLPTVVVGGIAILAFLNTLRPLIMVWFAPKIFIITEIVNLVK